MIGLHCGVRLDHVFSKSQVCQLQLSVACSPLAQGSANRWALLASTALDPGRSARHCWLMAEETDFSSLSFEDALKRLDAIVQRSEEHTSELQSLMRISYAVFCLKKKNNN